MLDCCVYVACLVRNLWQTRCQYWGCHFDHCSEALGHSSKANLKFISTMNLKSIESNRTVADLSFLFKNHKLSNLPWTVFKQCKFVRFENEKYIRYPYFSFRNISTEYFSQISFSSQHPSIITSRTITLSVFLIHRFYGIFPSKISFSSQHPSIVLNIVHHFYGTFLPNFILFSPSIARNNCKAMFPRLVNEFS